MEFHWIVYIRKRKRLTEKKNSLWLKAYLLVNVRVTHKMDRFFFYFVLGLFGFSLHLLFTSMRRYLSKVEWFILFFFLEMFYHLLIDVIFCTFYGSKIFLFNHEKAKRRTKLILLIFILLWLRKYFIHSNKFFLLDKLGADDCKFARIWEKEIALLI